MDVKGGENLSKKVKKLKESDFLSISARVRVLETRLLTAERMERIYREQAERRSGCRREVPA